MKHDANGNKLFKRIHVKVIVGEKVYNHDYRAPAGHFYNHENIDDAREKMVDYIDKKFPYVEFRMVDIGPSAFNFIASGARQKEVSDGAREQTREQESDVSDNHHA